MPEVKKVSEEQLQSLRGLQTQFTGLMTHLGELHYQQRLLDRELKAVDAALDTLETTRQDMVQSLQAEFGSTGTIDLSTGEFVPD